MDKTIQKLLRNYAERCEKILDKETKSLQKRKFYDEKDRAEALQEHTKEKQALNFLMEIVKDPKKYLYRGNNILCTRLNNGKSIYEMLLPLMTQKFDRSKNGNLLVRLSENIVRHVKYGHNDYNGVWMYYGPHRVGLSTYSSDLEAEKILQMNKVVSLWNSNDFVAAFKDFAPATVFAIKEKDGR